MSQEPPLRILWVSDQARADTTLRRRLQAVEQFQFELREAQRLADAEAELENPWAEVILATLDLEDAVGLEVCARLVAKAPNVPLVVLTASEPLARRALEHGAQDVVSPEVAHGSELVRTLRFAVHRQAFRHQERESALRSRLALVAVADRPDEPEGAAASARQVVERMSHTNPDPVFVMNVDDRTLRYANPAMAVVLDADEVPRSVYDAVMECRADLEGLEVNEVVQTSFEVVDTQSRRRWFSVRVSVFRRHPGGEVASVLCVGRDVTRRRALEQELERMANQDLLTGLANRRVLEERFHRAVGRTSGAAQLAMLCLDFDRFKVVNDTQGHHVGDLLLTRAAARLMELVEPTELVARLGSDGFALLLYEYDEAQAQTLASRIQEDLQRPYDIEGASIALTVSVGIALYPRDGDEFAEIFRRADLAMHRAKVDGGTICFHDEQVEARVRRAAWIERELRRALTENALHLHFQPVVDVHTGVFQMAEVLLRWSHPEEGWISPADFVPIAESVGLAARLDRWVLTRALATAGEAGFPVSVNVTPQTLIRPDFPTFLSGLLGEHGLASGDLHLELTERIFAGPETLLETTRVLREMGVRITIDDFGTGYSSLSYLRQFPLDVLKVDRSFIAALHRDRKTSAVTETVVRLARSLGLKAVAEGVETVEQLEWLRQIGCDLAQGFYFARPMPLEAFQVWLSQQAAPAE